MIRTEDYNYDLPEELIAQTPLKVRSESRLLVLDRETKTYEDRKFNNILEYITENDVLVLNDTKVIPARLYGVKEETNASIEL
ncbi:MAG: S-adenosylmethionine:tRNA ribosyltransferase-isomerase, partial [Acholeplasmatales bacterium]|nr:S-adenosylmethionine:tRNA ribosyltransferase-isomerase [Acholeplasmatales bacterium]